MKITIQLLGSLGSTLVISKNKRVVKGGKKRAKKRVVDPFWEKDRCGVKAPSMFNARNVENPLVVRTQGTKRI